MNERTKLIKQLRWDFPSQLPVYGPARVNADEKPSCTKKLLCVRELFSGPLSVLFVFITVVSSTERKYEIAKIYTF